MQQALPPVTSSSPQPGENQPAGADSVPPHAVAPAAVAEQNALIVHEQQPDQQVATTSPAADGANGTLGFTPGVEVVSPSAYLDLLRKFRSVWKEQPDVTISYTDLAYTVKIPVTDTKVGTLVSAVVDAAKKPFQGARGYTELKALQPTSGRIRPGSMTLILAPPGHGKTSLLKALAGRLSHDSNLTGTVRYNNLTAKENLEHGVHVSRIGSYVGQSDLLFPVLTVTETLRFASQSSLPDARLLLETPNLSAEDRAIVEEIIQLDQQRPEMLIQLLGLSEAANTIVGNELLRGVSGGQKKRVGLGEMLLTNARAFFLDEVTTGLDAAVSLHIFTALKQACSLNHTSVVTALLQPTPETYGLFDDILLLKDGHTVFHGPRDDIPSWLWEVAGLEVPQGVDEAGFLVDFLADPHTQYDLAQKAFIKRNMGAADNQPTPELSKQQQEQQQPAAAQANGRPASIVTNGQPNGVDAKGGRETPSVVRIHLGPDAEEAAAPAAAPVEAVQPVAVVVDAAPTPALPNAPVPAAHHDGNGLTVPAAAGVAAAPSDDRVKGLRHGMSSSSFAPMYHSRAQASPVYGSEELEARYKASRFFAAMQTEVSLAEKNVAPLDASKWSPYTRVSYGSRYPHSVLKHMGYSLSRQWKLTIRDRTMIPPRIVQAVLMGLIFGSLFVQLGYAKFADRMGLLLYVIMTGAFSNLTELPVASEARNVISKQIDAGFFPSASYSLSVALLHMPITAIEICIFGSLIYWIPGFYASADRFFFFLLVLWLNSNALSVFFRCISYVAKNPDVARQMDMPFIIIFVIFGGFLIVYDKIPKWLLWLYYGSPFGWGVRSLAQSEFGSDKYDAVSATSPNGERDGDVFLDQFGVFTGQIWKWMGPLYLACFYLIFLSCNALLLNNLKPVTPMGTRKTANANAKAKGAGKQERLAIASPNSNGALQDAYTARNQAGAAGVTTGSLGLFTVGAAGTVLSAQAGAYNNNNNAVQFESPDVAEDELIGNTPGSLPAAGDAVAVPVKTLGGSKQSFQLTALPFVPVTLSWRHINYTVDIPPAKRGDKPTKRQLLKDISGFAAPGKMTALMGSSGAGKTTLMDVIAGRKTVGYIEGDILINGHPKDPRTFDKLTGYVEQQDIHIGTATVRESLLFSAKLRLPLSVDQVSRERFVDEVMALVGLSHIAGRLVGDAALPGLSQGQLKLVTIAVELVANPSVIFLDEPTSGLDAPSAARVMKAVRRIAATGRTVLCTIHQPSEELFYFFDRLLLLKTGGEDVYQADIGRKGKKLVSYFEEASGFKQLLPRGSVEILPNGKKKVTLRQSPANWMLDVIGAAGQTHAGEQADYAQLWRASKLFQETEREIDDASTPRPNSKPIVLNEKYASTWTRYKEVQHRLYVSHWRNAPMNVTRFALLIVFAIVLGVVYYKIDRSDYGGVQSVLSVIFLGMSFPSSICAGSALPTFFRQRAVYYRETTIGLYGYQIFNAAVFLVELPYIIVCCFLFITIFYFMIGFSTSAALFFQFYLMSLLMCLCYSGLSQLWLALLPNQIAANVANGLVMNLFFMFGGLFIKPSSIPIGWKWMFYIDPVPKAFIGAAMTQFYCDTEDPTANCQKISPGAGQAAEYTYEYLKDLLEGSAGQYGQNVGWLVLEIVVVRIMVLLALRFVSHIKR